jgi:alkylhydroperoxidase/carboxymuconolactone decarboxylase family protein YurZ
VIISIKETKRAMQNINKTKSLLFEKTEMIDKTLPNLTKRENKISDEKWGRDIKNKYQ